MEAAATHLLKLHACMGIITAGNVALALVAVIVVAITLLVQYVVLTRAKSGKRCEGELLPPGPRPWPIVGNLLLLGELPHQSLARLALEYGDIMYLRLGSTPTIVVSSADMAKEILTNNDQVFANRPYTLASTVLTANKTDLIWANGSHWRYMRKMCQLELFSPKRLASFREVRAEEISATMKSILGESQEGKAVNLNLKLWSLTANNMTRMVVNKRYFGLEVDGREDERHFRLLFERIFYWFGLFLIGDYNPALEWVDKLRGIHESIKKFHLEVSAFFQKIIDEHRHESKRTNHRNGPSTTNFVDVLLSMPSEDGGDHLSDSTIRVIISDMLVAGADTTALTTEWAFAELLHHPHVMYRVQSELDDVVGSTRLVEELDIPSLKYLQAVVKEIFRLHPAAPLLLPHESSEACQVAGYTLPPRTQLLVNVWAIGRDPSIWDRPLHFEPERFLKHPEIDVKGHNFELLPFGSGRRGCVAQSLALTMVQFTLARLLHGFNWALPNQQDPDTLDMSEKFVLSLHRKHHLHALAQPRLATHLYL